MKQDKTLCWNCQGTGEITLQPNGVMKTECPVCRGQGIIIPREATEEDIADELSEKRGIDNAD